MDDDARDDDEASRQLSALRVFGVLMISLILVAAGMYVAWRTVMATPAPEGSSPAVAATASGSGLASAAWPGGGVAAPSAPVVGPSPAAAQSASSPNTAGAPAAAVLLGPCQLTPAGGYLKAAVSVTAEGPWTVQISVGNRTTTVSGTANATAVAVVGPFPPDGTPQTCQAQPVGQA